jgi:hypothetical protein
LHPFYEPILDVLWVDGFIFVILRDLIKGFC